MCLYLLVKCNGVECSSEFVKPTGSSVKNVKHEHIVENLKSY